MVDRGKFTYELEAAAHRFAAQTGRYDKFHLIAENGHLIYVGVEDANGELRYSLHDGEWRELKEL